MPRQIKTKSTAFAMTNVQPHAPLETRVSSGTSAHIPTDVFFTDNDTPVMKWAESYLQAMKHEWPAPIKLAVVFDIDDTILYHKNNQVWELGTVNALYRKARNLGYDIYFVTARVHSPDNEIYTRQQLEEHGFDVFSGLFMMPSDVLEKHDNWSQYKYSARKMIPVPIVLNVGDDWCDMMIQSPFISPGQSSINQNFMKQFQNSRHYIVFRPTPEQDISWRCVKLPQKKEK